MPGRWAVGLLLVSLAAAQAPPDLTLTLTSKDGRTRFQQGEPIDLELQFRSSVPEKYSVWTLHADRTARKADYDQFTVEPAAGTVDPLANSSAQFTRVLIGRPPAPAPIASEGVTVDLFLNEWICFRRPGRYRVSVATTRVNNGPKLRAGPLEIEILPPDRDWAAEQLRRAEAVLEVPDAPAPRIGQRVDMQQMQADREAAEYAGRVLRFLETPEAARALVRYLERGPAAAQAQLRAGLDGTPYRQEAIAAIEKAVAAPDIPIYREYYFALQRFAEIAELGPPPMTSADDEAYRDRAKPIDDAVTAKVTTALAGKSGQPLAISLAILAGAGPQMPPPTVGKALVANFALLPEESQAFWLTMNWPRIASPDAVPVLRALASGKGDLRDPALARLMELDPGAARPIAIERIRRADLYRDVHHDEGALLRLPDKTLPELDEALAGNFERGMYRAELLLARYASAAAAPRVKAAVERRALCNGPTLAYLFRVDPDYAAGWLARVRSQHPCSLIDLQGYEDLLMSPGLEKQLVQDLDPSITPGMAVNRIAALLQNGGSAAAKRPLMDALLRTPVDLTRANFILEAAGWLPAAADFETVFAACGDDGCRSGVEAIRTLLAEPVTIRCAGGSYASMFAAVGPFRLRSAQQMREKIAQFPKETSFVLRVPYEGSWWAENENRAIAHMVQEAGMRLEDQSPPKVAR